jgi:hypothetical protein
MVYTEHLNGRIEERLMDGKRERDRFRNEIETKEKTEKEGVGEEKHKIRKKIDSMVS